MKRRSVTRAIWFHRRPKLTRSRAVKAGAERDEQPNSLLFDRVGELYPATLPLSAMKNQGPDLATHVRNAAALRCVPRRESPH